jgi:protoheme IX farnesyltransferase
LNALAWILFAIIFVWTPVHFWALAILIKDDYAIAKVPMLPVLRGEQATAVQIGFYAIVTVVVTFMPSVMREVGWLYLVSAAALNWLLLAKSYQLWREPVRARASSLFHYSMLYLALLFLAMAVDRVVGI